MTTLSQSIGRLMGALILAFVYCLTVAEQNASPTWSYFVFTQQWPMAACIEGNATSHDCQIPENVTTWTIHGIWPSDPSQHEGPVNCNSSWKFDERKILTLENQLKKYWPNLYTGPPSEYSEFWAHEWDKHGTCSTDLPATADEFLYFSQGLLLNDKYNLTSLFNQYNILPGKSYKLSVYEDAITDAFGHPPNIQCVMNKTYAEEEKVYIYQIEICLDKSFGVIKCPHQAVLYFQSMASTPSYSSIETGLCSAHKEIQYLTLQH